MKKSFTRSNPTENFTLKTENSYIYDGWNLLAEIENGQAKTYTWGRDLSGSMQGAGGVGGLLAISENSDSQLPASSSSLKNRFPIYDANGNIGQMIAENSSIKAAYQYSSFGSVTATFGEEADSNPWRFSTKPVEADTGWSYYGFRYYDAGNGRWASRDPIDEEGGVNLFAYVANEVHQKIDKLGLKGAAEITAYARPNSGCQRRISFGKSLHYKQKGQGFLQGTEIGGNNLAKFIFQAASDTDDCECIKDLKITAHGSPAGAGLVIPSTFPPPSQVHKLIGFSILTERNAQKVFETLHSVGCFCRACTIRLDVCNLGLGKIPGIVAKATGCNVTAPMGYCYPNAFLTGNPDKITLDYGPNYPAFEGAEEKWKEFYP